MSDPVEILLDMCGQILVEHCPMTAFLFEVML